MNEELNDFKDSDLISELEYRGYHVTENLLDLLSDFSNEEIKEEYESRFNHNINSILENMYDSYVVSYNKERFDKYLKELFEQNLGWSF